jgi:hypothetical protein
MKIEVNDDTETMPEVITAMPKYDVQQVEKTGRWHVVRVGPKGGKKLVMSYSDTDMGQTAANVLAVQLTIYASDE